MELSVNKFRANLKVFVDKAINEHMVIRVKRRAGRDFIVISAEDWDRDQETLYILRHKELMSQVAESLETYTKHNGYQPTGEQLDEINRI